MKGGRYERLLAPGRIGSLALRNRIAMTPMGTNQERDDGHLGEAILDYYEARARGGVGLVIAGVASVQWPVGAANPCQAAISEDRFLPGWEEFARRVHAHGAAAAIQLQHAGKVAVEDMAAGRPLQVPSLPEAKRPDLYDALTPEELASATAALRRPGARMRFREMDEGDIEAAIASFASAARRAQRAGADGVELHAGHGYLIASFLSPASNRRSDRWGGSAEGRTRLLVETLRAVRSAVGRDYPVWVRLDGEELEIPDGITRADAARAARAAERAGADAIHVSAYADPGSGVAFTRAPLVHEPGGYLPLAANVKRAVGVPVIAVGRIEPERGEAALAAGEADFIAMGRKLLADPELPRRLAEDRERAARPCIYAYRCVGNVFLRRASRCVVNPEMGREGALPLEPAARSRRAVIVGGGPAGLEAARVAALRGHRVLLVERGDALGGRLRLAAGLDAAVAGWLDWAIAAVRDAGVEVALGRAADAAWLAALGADAVLVAVGARRAPPALSGAGAAPIPVETWLEEGQKAAPGEPIAILGDDVIAVRLAEQLAGSAALTLVGTRGHWAAEMAPPRRWRALDLLDRHGVARVQAPAGVQQVPGGLELPSEDGAPARQVAAARVVWAGGLAPADELVAELAALGVSARAIGDCAAPRYLEEALLAGALAARDL